MSNFSFRTHVLRAALSLSMIGGAAGLAGCSPKFQVPEAEVASSGQARVVLQGIEGKTFKLTVINESGSSMTVYRDRVTLNTPSGERDRIPGGLTNLYVIPPGGSHAVHVAFDLHGLETTQSVFIKMNNAIEIEGKPVTIKDIEAVVN